MIVFGPLWSRRLGWSLGVNNIPPKRCSYSCVYCQVGRTKRRTTVRRKTVSADEVARMVADRAERCRQLGREIDYVTFVPSGEPTLDVGLGSSIRAVRDLGHRVAVLTNGSLLTRADVRADLMAADLVSVKVDAVGATGWRSVNRPANGLDLASIREAILHFSRRFEGSLLTETMVVDGVNDDEASFHRLAHFVASVDPSRAYLTTPTRVPATDVSAPDERTMARLFSILAGHVRSAGLLLGGYPLMLTEVEDASSDLAATVAVHPLSEESIDEFLKASGRDWTLVEQLVQNGELRTRRYGSKLYLVRGREDETVLARRLRRRRARRGEAQ
jgi:wyosine [tRNA(Phe)-imidazoG37] synthetase (radical SAM superfamily)